MQISDVYVQNSATDAAKRASFGDSAANIKKETKKINANSINAENVSAKAENVSAKAENASAKVSISATPDKSGSAEALVEARAKALPEIREDKISLAKERMQSGYYNTPEFGGELSNRLLSNRFISQE